MRWQSSPCIITHFKNSSCPSDRTTRRSSPKTLKNQNTRKSFLACLAHLFSNQHELAKRSSRQQTLTYLQQKRCRTPHDRRFCFGSFLRVLARRPVLRDRREASFVTMATTIAAVLHPAELGDEAKHSIDRAIISDDFNARATNKPVSLSTQVV